MKLLRITLNGFRGFSQKQVVGLPQEPGLYLMRGVNEVDVALEGNDCGKSTLWDSVYWCLYGVTTRGLKAGNVVSWGAKSAKVVVRLEVDGKQHKVVRWQNPNELRLDGKAVVQASVDAVLGWTAAEFLHGVLFGQFADYFLDLGPSDKLGLFSDVLGLDYWEGRAEAAKEKVGALDVDVAGLSDQLAREEGRLGALQEREKALASDRDTWDNESAVKRSRLEKEVYRLRSRRDEAGSSLAIAKRKLNKDAQAEDEARGSLVASINRLDLATLKLRDMNADSKRDRCPFCRRPLDGKWREKVKGERKGLAAEVNDLKAKISQQKEARDGLTRAIDLAMNAEITLAGTANKLNNDLAAMEGGLSDGGVNPHEKPLVMLREDLRESKSRRGFLQAKHDLAVTACSRMRYWVKGFRDLRLWILDSTLAELEMRINNSMMQLGLGRWTLSLAVERENKSGGVTRGLQAVVRSPGSGDASPWKGWGGGVTQRLRVAAEIGLAKLIADRKGVDPSIEIWDEPECHLSNQGIGDLLEHLRSRAHEERKQIWIVSHRALDFSFDSTMIVTKSTEGSTVAFLGGRS